MTDRVKYYPSNDFFFGHNLSKIEVLQVPSLDEMEINDAIEFYQIKKYFNEGTRAKTWSDSNYEDYQKKCDALNALSYRFFNKINDDNIIDYYNSVEMGFHSDFWALFNNCNLYNSISNDKFRELISGEKISPHDLFLHRNIVNKYGDVLRDYILQNEHCIIILLQVYEQDHTPGDKLFLPNELTGDDICNYLENYIEGERVNANYIEPIIHMKYSKRFPVTDEIRLKAKRRYKREMESLSKTGVSISHGIQIIFDGHQDQVKSFMHTKDEDTISYSTKWLLDTLDYPSILNNFIYLFEYVDIAQMRSNHVSRISQSNVFERALASKSSRVYPSNHTFKYMNIIAAMQIHAYYDFLEKNGIRLEDVIKWFFAEHIQSEFGCPEIRVSMPSANSTYSEKCYSIITAFETVLKQYSLYVKNGEIDFELLEISTASIRFEDIKSLVPDKYLYGIGDDYNRLSFWLFSDQCMFSYIERMHQQGKNYDSFLELLLNEDVYVSDYREEELGAFKNLESYGLISIGEDGRITVNDIAKLTIMKDLFEHDVVSQWHYSSDAQDAILDFIKKGIFETKSTLFSQPEANYLNYLLNQSEYSNALEIRNKYIHGNQHVITDEDEHRKNYYIFLRLFVLLAIKINDDLCLKEMKKYSNKN